MKRILITGATGLVGSRIIDRHSNVIITSRNPESAARKFGDGIEVIHWDYQQGALDPDSVGRVDAVVNLMGEPISGRWNKQKKKRIRDSRVLGTRSLVESITKMPQKPECLISASAIGYYGDAADNKIAETDPPGSSYLADVCKEWEAAAAAVSDAGIRLVNLRVGIVMSTAGGALKEMLPIFRTGMGGRIGNGDQFFPWIHIDDLVSLILWAIEGTVSGPLNATAPTPVTNLEFTKTLAGVLNRPAFIPVPKFALRLALGEFADNLFASQRVIPAAATAAGFEFQFPDLQPALSDLLGS